MTMPSYPAPEQAAAPVPARGRYSLGGAAAGLVFIGAGAAFLADRLGALEVREAAILPAVVVGLGLALVIGSIQRHRGE